MKFLSSGKLTRLQLTTKKRINYREEIMILQVKGNMKPKRQTVKLEKIKVNGKWLKVKEILEEEIEVED